MTDLNYDASLLGISDFFEIGMGEEDLGDDELFALGLDVVAYVVGVFAEDEDTGVDEFEEDAAEGE